MQHIAAYFRANRGKHHLAGNKSRAFWRQKPLHNNPLNLHVRENNINVSAVLDKALREEIGRRWIAENADAFEENRKRVEAEGLWSDELRPW